jgi:hypothetical protein
MQMIATKLVSRLSVAMALAFTAIAPAAHAGSADSNCRVTTYYAEVGMKTKVGIMSSCPGTQGHTGRTTKFYNTAVIEYVEELQDPFVHPGSLPCEWPTECANEAPTPVVRAEAQKKPR